MANPEIPSEQSATSESPSRKGRRWVKVVLVLLLLLGVGTAAAFRFLTNASKKQQVVEYDKPDVDAAAAKEKAALTEVEKNKQALKDAQAAYDALETAWDKAKQARDKAETAAQTADAGDQVKAEFRAAEEQFAEVTKDLEDARTRLHGAKRKLKTADELRAEAEAERKKAEELAAKEEAIRKAVLGKWKRSDYYGDLTLELSDDGTGSMVIYFNFGAKLVVRSERLDVEIKWKVAGGDHLVFDSIRGHPEKAFRYVTVDRDKGTHRDEIVTNIEPDTFSTQNANDPSKLKTWTRISE